MGQSLSSARTKLASLVKRIGGSAQVQDLWTTVVDTVISIVPIVGFLIVFQLAVLRIPIANLKQVLLGIALSIVGLTIFTQGLRLGLLPLGEGVGQSLPSTGKMWLVLAAGFVMGYGVTLIEDTIGLLAWPSVCDCDYPRIDSTQADCRPSI